MSRPRFAKKLDSTHAAIKEHLEFHGCEVVDCSASGGVPDLLVKCGVMVGWIEAKAVKKDEPRFTYTQLAWMSNTTFPVRIVDNKEDALIFAKTHEGMLTQRQKDGLAAYLGRNQKRLHTPNQVLEAMGCALDAKG